MKKIILITLLISIFVKCNFYEEFNDDLRVDNKSNDTLCFWLAPIPNNKEFYEVFIDDNFDPSIILPKSLTSYGITMNWKTAIKRIKGGKMFLLDYHFIRLYKNKTLKLDSNVVSNVFRYSFSLNINKLDSCNWIIKYE